MGYKADIDDSKTRIITQEVLFKQSKSLEKLKNQDPEKAERIEYDSRKKILKQLNALRVMSPVINALMVNPGIYVKDLEIMNAFKKVVGYISELTNKTSNELGIDINDPSNFWIRNVLDKTFAQIVCDRWKANKEIDTSVIMATIPQIINVDDNFEKEEFNNFGSKLSMKVALIKSMSKFISVLDNSFDFLHNKDELIESVMEKILNRTYANIEKIADKNASERDKVSLFYILSEESVNIYCSVWLAESKKKVAALKECSEKELEEITEKYPNGLPLDDINDNFEKYLNRLITLSNKLTDDKINVIRKNI